jgi:hypothetical protein
MTRTCCCGASITVGAEFHTYWAGPIGEFLSEHKHCKKVIEFTNPVTSAPGANTTMWTQRGK